ncbi:histidine--tRNA ligase [Ancylobacter amanitiformis]|uniref:Histidine--tRNA ligase n=1 Tax=Ancylobacter amanitiformis TaxID=217069 RepID=A0ABU0LTF1_9HYPH|nr:histidine--tRNA ligase [Ancylobacter amanitiformis]MDQ0511984.1 histidyl-tRNA synthetase [Ancylobacter amanitiformis]
MAKDKPSKLKARKPQAQLPRGFADRGPAELAGTRAMLETIRKVYELYGFEALETPFIEYTDALGKFLPDQDRPNEGVFSFQDDDEQWLSLRYDLTAPLARHVAENFDKLPKPFRSYRAGWVFRNEKPGPGRFRQFMQFDADTVGAPSVAADAEICMMAADTLEELGIQRGDYVIKVNNRKVLDGVLEAIGLGGEENAGRRLTVLRAIDKFDKVGPSGVEDLLGAGRWENPATESGDFTKGANLSNWQVDGIMRFLNVEPSAGIRADSRRFSKAEFEEKWGSDPVEWFRHRDQPALATELHNFFNDWLGIFGAAPPIFDDGIAELREIAKIVGVLDYGADRIRIDPSVVRGLEYYTGPVFEAELTFEVKDEKGRPVRFGSVGGGGRYDGLVGRFRSEPVPATGFSIGVSRLASALSYLNKAEAKPDFGPVVVVVMDRDQSAHYMGLVAKLRKEGIRAEMYLGNPKNLGNQFKYADRRNSPCVVIQGSDERAATDEVGNPRPMVQIKDLIEGAKAAAAIADNAEWRESRPAQFACAEAELVAKVREVLDHHGVPHGEALG